MKRFLLGSWMQHTKLAFMNLSVALLSSAKLDLPAGSSAFLILEKYCLTRINSVKTGCSRALTPWSRRYAVDMLVIKAWDVVERVQTE